MSLANSGVVNRLTKSHVHADFHLTDRLSMRIGVLIFFVSRIGTS